MLWYEQYTRIQCLPLPHISIPIEHKRFGLISWNWRLQLFGRDLSYDLQPAWVEPHKKHKCFEIERLLCACKNLRKYFVHSSTPIHRNKYLFITTVSCCSHSGDILYYGVRSAMPTLTMCLERWAFSIEKSYAHDKPNEIVERILHLEETISISTQTSGARQKKEEKNISKIYCSRLVQIEKKYWATKQTQRWS